MKPFSFPSPDTKGESRERGESRSSPEYVDFLMLSLRAAHRNVVWSQLSPFVSVGTDREGTHEVPHPHVRAQPRGSAALPLISAHLSSSRTQFWAVPTLLAWTGVERDAASLVVARYHLGKQTGAVGYCCQPPALEKPLLSVTVAMEGKGISCLQPGTPHGFDSALCCQNSSDQCCSAALLILVQSALLARQHPAV